MTFFRFLSFFAKNNSANDFFTLSVDFRSRLWYNFLNSYPKELFL